MKKILMTALAIGLGACLGVSQAAPHSLQLINATDHESDAAIHGALTGSPIAANSVWSLDWASVVNTCHNTTNEITDVCAAEIYAQTDSASPIDVGTLVIYLNTGTVTALNRDNTGYVLKPFGAGKAILMRG